MERGDKRAAVWEYRTPSGTTMVVAPGREGAQGEGQFRGSSIYLTAHSRLWLWLWVGLQVNCRLALGRKAAPILRQFNVWMGVPPSSAISVYISVSVYHSSVSLDSPRWIHHSKPGQAGGCLHLWHCPVPLGLHKGRDVAQRAGKQE